MRKHSRDDAAKTKKKKKMQYMNHGFVLRE